MYIVSLISLYFPYGVTKTSTVTHEGISKQINSRILKQSSAGNVKITRKALKSVTKEVYDITGILCPLLLDLFFVCSGLISLFFF